MLRESSVMTYLLRAIWIIAFAYDWATSMVAVINLAGLADHPFDLIRIINANSPTRMRYITAGLAALVICGATLVVSFMAYTERREGVAEA